MMQRTEEYLASSDASSRNAKSPELHRKIAKQLKMNAARRLSSLDQFAFPLGQKAPKYKVKPTGALSPPLGTSLAMSPGATPGATQGATQGAGTVTPPSPSKPAAPQESVATTGKEKKAL